MIKAHELLADVRARHESLIKSRYYSFEAREMAERCLLTFENAIRYFDRPESNGYDVYVSKKDVIDVLRMVMNDGNKFRMIDFDDALYMIERLRAVKIEDKGGAD